MRSGTFTSLLLFLCSSWGISASVHAETTPADEGAVTRVLLLNAVRGAERVQGALGFKFEAPCGQGTEVQPQSRPAILLFPKTADEGGQSLHLLLGGRGLPGGTYANGDHTFSAQWAYEVPYKDGYRAGLTYLNEGHTVGDHHRDLLSPQIWKYWGEGRFRAGVGAGPALYFDTRRAGNKDGYEDGHGLGVLLSASVQADVTRNVFVEARLNRSIAVQSFNATSLQFGLGYRFSEDGSGSKISYDSNSSEPGSLRMMTGLSIVNSFESETARPFQLEFAKKVSGPLGYTVSFLHEGDAKVLARQGVAAQASLTSSVLNDRVRFSVAAGPYLNVDSRAGEFGRSRTNLDGLITVGAEVDITEKFGVRAAFNRVLTSDSRRDTDVILIGVTYKY